MMQYKSHSCIWVIIYQLKFGKTEKIIAMVHFLCFPNKARCEITRE